MRLLLDESVPRPLGAHFPPSFEIHTVQRMGWSGRSNGDLLRLAASHGFVTADRGIEYRNCSPGLGSGIQDLSVA